jgi:hypothetical protein
MLLCFLLTLAPKASRSSVVMIGVLYFGSSESPHQPDLCQPSAHFIYYYYLVRLIVGFSLLAIYIIVVPETREGPILAARARRLRRDTGNNRLFALHEKAHRSISEMFSETLFRPLVMLVTEPIVLLFALWDGMSYAMASLPLSF